MSGSTKKRELVRKSLRELMEHTGYRTLRNGTVTREESLVGPDRVRFGNLYKRSESGLWEFVEVHHYCGERTYGDTFRFHEDDVAEVNMEWAEIRLGEYVKLDELNNYSLPA